MAIAALSDQTVRLLGSSQLVSSPRTVVKELIDNALDAAATSIAVDITANTLDTIQVRDNGRGVAPEDRSLLCKQHCTSKMRDLNDLENVASHSLGFRGEALAGIAEIAGSIHLTTRVHGEKVACVLKFHNGRNVSRESSSLAVGTTVKVLDLFKHIPIRRQTVAKSAARCLVKVKELIQAYALTHPTVRFFLRISKSRFPRPDWIYTPGPAEDIGLAAIKVLGKDCAHQCQRQSLEHHGYVLDAFLFSPSANVDKINGHGAFISIDLRPMSASKGPLQRIYKLYKDKIKLAIRYEAYDPFIYLNLSCPPSAYDINMEPAKDDVIFGASTVVLEAASQLFDSVYGKDNSPIEVESPDEVLQERFIDPLGKDPAATTGSPQWGPIPMNAHASNPWIYAKMHSPTKARRLFDGQEIDPQALSQNLDSLARALPEDQPGHLPTPDVSSSPQRVPYNGVVAEEPLTDENDDVISQDMETHDQLLDRLGTVQSTFQTNMHGDDNLLAAEQPLVGNNLESVVREGAQRDKPRRQRGLSAPFKVPRRVAAQSGFNASTAALHLPKRRLPANRNSQYRAKVPRLDHGSAPSAQIKLSADRGDKTSDKGHEGFVEDWLRHQVAPDATAASGQRQYQERIVSQSRGDGAHTGATRDADIAELFLKNSSPRLDHQAPAAIQLSDGAASAQPTVRQHVDRLVAALSTSAQAIQECCNVLRSANLIDATYPDVPLAETADEDGLDDGSQASCPATPETLRPTSLSSVSGEEMEKWRIHLLDFLAQAREGAEAQATQTAVC